MWIKDGDIIIKNKFGMLWRKLILRVCHKQTYRKGDENKVQGLELNDLLLKSLSPLSSTEEKETITIENYLLEQLNIDTSQMTEEKKKLLHKNFTHLVCLVIADLNVIRKRLTAYKTERSGLEGVKSNEAEYRRRKLEYFAKLNKAAQDEIVDFLNNRMAEYLLETDYDTLERDSNADELGRMFRNRRYTFAQFPQYYDIDFDFSTVVKASQLPGVDLIDMPATEKKHLELRKNSPEGYYREIARIIKSKKVMETLLEDVKGNYHLYKRQEIFEDLLRLYKEKHFQSFVALGLLQLEGLFFDICSIRYEEKENAGSLVEKAQKALESKNAIYFMRMYPYFAFDVPVRRNEIAHTGLIKKDDLEHIADELVLDLNAVARIAKMESDGNFRVFMMINEAMNEIDSSDEKSVNQKLFYEIFANRVISTDSFWKVLKNPSDFEEELNFYRIDNLPEGYVDLPTVVKFISDLVYKTSFWEEMVIVMNDFKNNKEMSQFLLKMAKDYVKVLDTEPKKRCIEILRTLK